MITSIDQGIEQLSKQIHALTEVSKTLTSPLELHELLNAVMDRMIGVLDPADIGSIMLWDHSAGLFRMEACFGFDYEVMKNLGLRAGESITGKVFDEGCPRLLEDPGEIAEAIADMRAANRQVLEKSLGGASYQPVGILAVPLSGGAQKYGVLVLETQNPAARFTQADIPFVQTLADLIALAIDRARLQTKADVIREANQAERLRSEVMAALSHQLRMPLSAIKGYATALLLEEVAWSEGKKAEFLRYIDEECDSMQSMITELLDSSLIDVGQLCIEPQPVRLPPVAHDIGFELQRRTDGHQIIIDFPPEFPIVEADPRWIKQVFRNILDNSIKYSPDGGLVVIRGEVRREDVLVSIADQGVGISPEDLIPLFEKYFRVNPHDLHVPGTGLGLPIARAIVEAHKGRIWAESKLGQGTILYFTLPYIRVEDEKGYR
jgi:K+-sensing histidine kinase KdpD